MKIATVIGARPQFVKAAVVSRELRKDCQEILIHTGQHYDKNMSDIFFKELEIPYPDYNLNAGSGSHAVQTGEMLIGIEDILIREKPDVLLVYGDTNSTLAGALAAVKIHIPIAHVEAGLRSFNMRMPEEVNRILTDKVSDLLFCPTDTARQNLEKENIVSGVHIVGDVMCDAVLYYSKNLLSPEMYAGQMVPLFTDNLIDLENPFYLATIHRAENTDAAEKIEEILSALEALDAPVIFPLHPRTKAMVQALHEKKAYKNIAFVQPVGYKTMLFLAKNAKAVITDSGGLQKECYILETPCVTVRDQTEWTETLAGNCNILVQPAKDEILNAVYKDRVFNDFSEFYGDGTAAEKIHEILRKAL